MFCPAGLHGCGRETGQHSVHCSRRGSGEGTPDWAARVRRRESAGTYSNHSPCIHSAYTIPQRERRAEVLYFPLAYISGLDTNTAAYRKVTRLSQATRTGISSKRHRTAMAPRSVAAAPLGEGKPLPAFLPDKPDITLAVYVFAQFPPTTLLNSERRWSAFARCSKPSSSPLPRVAESPRSGNYSLLNSKSITII